LVLAGLGSTNGRDLRREETAGTRVGSGWVVTGHRVPTMDRAVLGVAGLTHPQAVGETKHLFSLM
jgi:hypothetical protein